MKSFLYFLIFLFMFYPCFSRWKQINQNDNFSEYIDVDTVKKIEDHVYVWSMLDFKKPIKENNLSTKYYSVIDCDNTRLKIISIIDYKTNMGRGRDFKYRKNATSSILDLDWVYPNLTSTNFAKIDFICKPQNKKKPG